jgi:hypothetical protein
MATMKLELNPFDVPDHVTVKLPPGRREDGMQALPTIALQDIDEETLASLCDEFTEAVFAAAGKSV